LTATPESTWGIAPAVRKILAKRILELRGLLEDDTRRQLAALGITADGIAEVPAGRTLTEDEGSAREVAEAVIRAARDAGSRHETAFDDYVRETAFTYLNRAVGLRCLEERGLLIVDGQPETVIKTDPVRGVASLAWRVRNEHPDFGPREVAREAFVRACAAITERIAVLFDPAAEHAVLFPLAATVNRVSEVLNDPGIPASVYAEDEVLGWVYQYWNSDDKDRVYAKLKKGGKIEGPEELSAASTLYTERYIVDYLLQNTLGTLWTELKPDTALRSTWPYYVTPPEGNEIPTRESKRVRDITLLDPAVGSGHFLVRAFDLFRQLYAEEGTEDPVKVPALILERNLFGIDIDTRATQIAALALYAKAASALADITGDPRAPFTPRRINLVSADITLPPGDPPADLLAELPEPELQELAKGLWASLQGAHDFGSLLHPERTINETFARLKARDRDGLWAADDKAWTERRRTLIATLERTFEREAASDDLGQRLFGEQASRGLSFVQALRRRYDVVVANPPYAGAGNLADEVRAFLAREYRDGRGDLYAAFIVRCTEFANGGRRAGRVGMVTRQSWMFQTSFVDLRLSLLGSATISTLAHLGAHAFEEISGEVVSVVAIAIACAPPGSGHLVACLRITGGADPTSKQRDLRRAVAFGVDRYNVSQSGFVDLPQAPLVYWVPRSLLQLLSTKHVVGSIAAVRQGMSTGDNERFVVASWEPGYGFLNRGWRWFARGGSYSRWIGLENYVVQWSRDGLAIKSTGRAAVRSEALYFRDGLTYTQAAGGNLGVRILRDASFGNASNAVFGDRTVASMAIVLNSRVCTFFARAIAQKMTFEVGHLERLPVPVRTLRAAHEPVLVALKTVVVARLLEERAFIAVSVEERSVSGNSAAALLHALEGWNERLVFGAYELGPDDVQAVIDETGTPAGWYPLIVGYDAMPEPPEGIELPDGLTEFLATLEHRTLTVHELATLKSNVRTLYEAGPGAKVELDEGGSAASDDEDGAALGARIPIPTETFLEELSQRLEIHPISVHWLLIELRERDGVVSPPLRARELEDYLQVTILRILGYRWPEQDAYEAEHGPLLPPDLVDPDGIVPLVAIDDQTTMTDRIRDRLERQFGEDDADAMLRDIKRYLKRDLDDWLKRDFFKSHIPRFKQRPIAWHLTSPAGEFAALVLYHRLSRETLERLRAQYAGDRIKRLEAELARAQARDNASEVSRLKAAIEDVEEFQRRIEAIERGATLADRIRCRWKDEEATGRPGPYTPDIDDGVKVNIRPFQEAGLFPVKTVIRKW
jgi:Eco57I restriction endonuclease.